MQLSRAARATAWPGAHDAESRSAFAKKTSAVLSKHEASCLSVPPPMSGHSQSPCFCSLLLVLRATHTIEKGIADEGYPSQPKGSTFGEE